MDVAGWSPNDKGEYEALLDEMLRVDNSRERYDRMVDALYDAQQAHRGWAYDVQRDAMRLGCAQLLRRAEKVRTSVAIAHDGRRLSKPLMRGTTTRDDEGNIVHKRRLFHLWTWAELERAVAESGRVIRGQQDNVATYRKLLALRDQVPNAETPAEACKVLGTTVERYLSEAAA